MHPHHVHVPIRVEAAKKLGFIEGAKFGGAVAFFEYFAVVLKASVRLRCGSSAASVRIRTVSDGPSVYGSYGVRTVREPYAKYGAAPFVIYMRLAVGQTQFLSYKLQFRALDLKIAILDMFLYIYIYIYIKY